MNHRIAGHPERILTRECNLPAPFFRSGRQIPDEKSRSRRGKIEPFCYQYLYFDPRLSYRQGECVKSHSDCRKTLATISGTWSKGWIDSLKPGLIQTKPVTFLRLKIKLPETEPCPNQAKIVSPFQSAHSTSNPNFS